MRFIVFKLSQRSTCGVSGNSCQLCRIQRGFPCIQKSELSYCPCGSLKYNYNKFCSKSCAAKSRKKIEWEKIDLVEMVKNKNLTQIGRELKVSDNTIRKRLEKQRGGKKRIRTI